MKLRNWVRFLVLCVSTIMFGLLSGCGGGGGGGGTTTVNGSTVIPATTKVLDDSSATKISSIAPDQSTVTFTGTNSQIDNLKSGDVLVLGVTPAAPEGLLKKITGVQKNPDGTTTLQTGTATLEEAVQKASVSYSKAFTVSDVVSEVTVAKGVSKSVPLSMSADQISLLLNDVVIYDRDDNLQTKGDQITVNGKISFKPTVDLKIEIDSSTLKKFSFSVTGEESSELTIKAEVPVPALDKKKLLKTYNLGTQTFLIGYVPVVVTYELGIYVGVKGNISLGLSANANQKLTYTGGVKYEDNNWSPINTNTTDFGFQLPTIDAAAEAKCYVGPELSTKLYGVAGPFINIYGYLLLQANLQSTPWWELFAGFEGNAGAKIEMLSGKITARYDVNLFEIKKSLAQAPTTYSITGRVTYNGNGISGVTVSANGGSGTTDANGDYSISGLPDGSYTLTPSKAGYSLTPTSQSVTVNAANVTGKNFTATVTTATTYNSISGTITSGGLALAGVTVSTNGGSTSTASNGNYTISGLANGNYTLTPSKTGYTFTPANQSVIVNGANLTGKDFTAAVTAATTYSISGTITSGGVAIAGVTVSTTGGSSITVSNGNYTINGLANGNYALTPGKSGYSFSPTSQSITINGANVTGYNFSATSVPRFIDKGNGTIYDTISKLTWLKNANCIGAKDWNTAHLFAIGLASGQCGLSDGTVANQWHMPTYDEYWTLIGDGYRSSTLNASGFSNVQSNSYWSSSGPGINGYAYDVHMGTGLTSEWGVNMYASLSVWAVR